jgi:hypothetical protein
MGIERKLNVSIYSVCLKDGEFSKPKNGQRLFDGWGPPKQQLIRLLLAKFTPKPTITPVTGRLAPLPAIPGLDASYAAPIPLRLMMPCPFTLVDSKSKRLSTASTRFFNGWMQCFVAFGLDKNCKFYKIHEVTLVYFYS